MREDGKDEEDDGTGVKRTDEASHDELNLAVRGNDDSHHNGRDIGELLHVWRSNHEGPCSEESGNHVRCLFGKKKEKVSIPASHTSNRSWIFSYLQHLNKRHTQIEIGDISTDQTEAEEQTNGKDGSSVGFAVHRHLVSGIENGRKFGQTLGHDRGEEHVPCRQEEWEFCFFNISISKSTQCILSIPLPGRQKEKKKRKKRKKRKKKRTYQTSPYATPIY